ncbi:unnamed protein product, partial [Nesidiocoris tenuis]
MEEDKSNQPSKKKRCTTWTCRDSTNRTLGFDLTALSNWQSFKELLFLPADPSSLAVMRVFF